MSVLRLDIEGNAKSIQYRTFIGIAQDALGILSDIDHAFSRRRNGALDWYMNDLSMNGRLRLEIYSRVRTMKRKELSDIGGEVASSFVRGFSVLEKEGRSPEYLTDYGMNRAKELTQVIGAEGPQAIVASALETNASVEITQQAAKNLITLLPTKYHAIGSIEGNLEAISIHGRPRFYVYLGLSNKAVSCHFNYRMFPDLLTKAKDALGARVQVVGDVYRNAKGEPAKVVLRDKDALRIFGIDLKVLPFKRLGGSDPNFTGGLTTEEFMRRIRG